MRGGNNMTATCGDGLLLVDSDVDLLALQFLDSDYAGHPYANWPIDRRLEAFLRNRGMARVADDGDSSRLLLSRVMSYHSVVAAQRDRVEDPPRADNHARPDAVAGRTQRSEASALR